MVSKILYKFLDGDLWIKEVDMNQSIIIIRLLAFAQGIFSGVAIIGGYIFLFYTPLGLALVIIYACPVVGMVLPRLFPQKRFYASGLLPVVLLIFCFAITPLFLYTIHNHGGAQLLSNDIQQTKTQTDLKHNFSPNQTKNENAGDDASEKIGLKWYYLGMATALLISLSDASHKIIVGYLFGNQSTDSTILTTYYAGYGGIVVGLIAAIFDDNQRLLSSQIKSIPTLYWMLLLGLAFLKLTTFLIINSAVRFIRPLVLFLMKHCKKRPDML